MELSTGQPLRFLILDDNPDDRAMTIRALRQDFPSMSAREVFDRRAFDEAMAEGNFDVVITDFKMGWTDGVKVVGEIKRKFPDVAVIIFTATGIGIAAGDCERVFRVFERLHAQEVYPGSGVGLALVKRGIERMGGRVGVESEPGEGSRFWIELPANRAAA